MDFLTFHGKVFSISTYADELMHTNHRNHENIRQGTRKLRRALRALEIEIEKDAQRSWDRGSAL